MTRARTRRCCHRKGKQDQRQKMTVLKFIIPAATTLLLVLSPLMDRAEGWSTFNRRSVRRQHHLRSLKMWPPETTASNRSFNRINKTVQVLSLQTPLMNGRPNRLRSRRQEQQQQHRDASTTLRRSNNDDDNDKNIIEDLNFLKTENALLRDTIRELQHENDKLIAQQQHAVVASTSSPPKIILETFEGERYFRQQHGSSNNNKNNVKEFGSADLDSIVATTVSQSSSSSTPGITMTGDEQQLSSTTDRNGFVNNSDSNELWCDDVLEDGSCPIEPTVSFGEALRDRAYWLVGLLIMQSLSGIILASNEALLANHTEIVYYLTMMVGAGGNAGNQASVRVIRGLALGTLNDQTRNQFLTRELKMAASLSMILSVAGFCRAIAFRTAFPEAITVTSALFLIVFTSICLGAVLPLILERIGVDPAHSSTTIQVIMDIAGVFLAVVVSRAILDGPLGVYVLSKLGYL